MAPTIGQGGAEIPQSAVDVHERHQALARLNLYHRERAQLVEKLLKLEDKILETSAFEDALSTNINESSELIATMCDILESDATDSNSDLVLTLLEDISAEELSRDDNMKRKEGFAELIFRYNNAHTEVMSKLSLVENKMQILEQILC